MCTLQYSMVGQMKGDLRSLEEREESEEEEEEEGEEEAVPEGKQNNKSRCAV